MEPILSALFAAIDEVNAMRPASGKLEKSPETLLGSPGSQLDSLGLVNFIVAVEMNLEQETGVSVDLADSRAMAQENSPFHSIGTLAAYISKLLEEKRNGAAKP
jgi:acyl carrier protein